MGEAGEVSARARARARARVKGKGRCQVLGWMLDLTGGGSQATPPARTWSRGYEGAPMVPE